ncbi:hypothetical protein [Chitinimonas koreensis]|uniref:hypothetical protein n=1 Tax=Chitinimonas koreensis TaxID=356302 RepID=UPI000490DB35|nr:hypothetical protein [Chitinimonas koreensis]QNM97609.1 hypothetical protein H9L41_04730 [Chitinimonas koreensis]
MRTPTRQPGRRVAGEEALRGPAPPVGWRAPEGGPPTLDYARQPAGTYATEAAMPASKPAQPRQYPPSPHEQAFRQPAILPADEATTCYQAARGLVGVLALLAADDAEREAVECHEEGGQPLAPDLRADLLSAAMALSQQLAAAFDLAKVRDRSGRPER